MERVGDRGIEIPCPESRPAHEIVHVGVQEEQVLLAREQVGPVEYQGARERLYRRLEPVRGVAEPHTGAAVYKGKFIDLACIGVLNWKPQARVLLRIFMP